MLWVGATEAGSLHFAFPFCLCAFWQKTCPLVGRGSGPQTTGLPLAGLGITHKKQPSWTSFLLRHFLTSSPFLDRCCPKYLAYISSVGCGEDEGKQQAIRLLDRRYWMVNTVRMVRHSSFSCTKSISASHFRETQRKTALKKALHKSLLVTRIRGYSSLDLNEHLTNQKHQHCRDLHTELIIPRFLTLFELW